MPGVGQILPIAVLLHNNDTTKFVRASVKDPDGAHISGSPFSLSHLGNGEYGLKTVAMPDKEYVTVDYEVFNEAGFINKDAENHIDGYDKFMKTDPVILDIQNTVNGIAGGGFGGDLEMNVEDLSLEMDLVADPVLSMELESDEPELTLEIEEDEIDVQDDDTDLEVEN